VSRITSLSRRIASISESMTIAISSRAKALKAEGADIIDFGLGEPDFDTPQHIKLAAIEAINQGCTKYTPAAGTPQLRQAVAEKFKKNNGLEYDPAQIFLSCGAKHSLFNIILACCEEGDEVIIPTPYWVSYPEMVKASGAECVFLPTSEENQFKISPDQLANALTPRSRMLIINSPSNPSGSVYTASELGALAAVVADHTGIVILSDEIYEALVYDGVQHVSIASMPGMFERTVVVNGFSKAYAMTGWRLGYAAGHTEIIKAAIRLQSHVTSGPCTISQAAGLAALAGDQTCVEEMRKEFDRRRRFVIEGLNAIDGITCIEPKGAFYALPNVSTFCGREIKGRKVSGSMDFAQLCLEKAKIAVVPGCAFGDDTVIRLSYATSLDNIRRGLARLADMLP